MSATAGKPNPWTGRPRFGLPQPTASAVRLFCFTPAGGGPTMYTQHAWAELPPSIELMPVLLPGRAQRLAESPLDSVEAMAAGALRGLRPMLDERPYALFGHSLGASVALEFARLVAADGAVAQPVHLIVSARLPQGSLKPVSGGGGRLLSDIADDREFIAAIHGKYGTLQMVLDNPDLMEMVLPMMRADFRAAETYALSPLESPLAVRAPSSPFSMLSCRWLSDGTHSGSTCIARALSGLRFATTADWLRCRQSQVPITALGGELDGYSAEQLEAWSALTVDFRGVTMLDGAKHMYASEPPQAMCELLVRTLSHP